MDDLLLDDNFESKAVFTKESLRELRLLRNKINQLIRRIKYGRLLMSIFAALAAIGLCIAIYIEIQAPGQEEGAPLFIFSLPFLIIYSVLVFTFNYNYKLVLILGLISTISFLCLFLLQLQTISEEQFSFFFIPFLFGNSIKAMLDLPWELEKLKKTGVSSQWIIVATHLKELPKTKVLIQ